MPVLLYTIVGFHKIQLSIFRGCRQMPVKGQRTICSLQAASGNFKRDTEGSKMQEKHESTHFLKHSMFFIIIICIGIFIFLGIYTNKQSDKTIDQVGSLYMASMNERISKHFLTMVDLRLTQLDTLAETIPTKTREDNDEIRGWLEYNGKIRGFEALAYFFEDGSFEMIYGTPAASVNADRFFQSMQNGERKVSVGVGVNGEQSAFLGIPLEVSLSDGRKSIAIVGRMPIDYISETLSLGEENSLMYSFVIRQDGSFVVRTMGASRDNYFERARALYEHVEGKRDIEQFILELQTAIAEKEDYSAMFTMNGGLLQMYCSSLPSSDWYLITVLPYGALNETVEKQGRQMLFISLGSCLVILLALFLRYLRYYQMNLNQ